MTYTAYLFRTVQQVKTKLKNMRKEGKKNFQEERKEVKRTGGGKGKNIIIQEAEAIITDTYRNSKKWTGVDGGVESIKLPALEKTKEKSKPGLFNIPEECKYVNVDNNDSNGDDDAGNEDEVEIVGSGSESDGDVVDMTGRGRGRGRESEEDVEDMTGRGGESDEDDVDMTGRGRKSYEDEFLPKPRFQSNKVSTALFSKLKKHSPPRSPYRFHDEVPKKVYLRNPIIPHTSTSRMQDSMEAQDDDMLSVASGSTVNYSPTRRRSLILSPNLRLSPNIYRSKSTSTTQQPQPESSEGNHVGMGVAPFQFSFQSKEKEVAKHVPPKDEVAPTAPFQFPFPIPEAANHEVAAEEPFQFQWPVTAVVTEPGEADKTEEAKTEEAKTEATNIVEEVRTSVILFLFFRYPLHYTPIIFYKKLDSLNKKGF